MLFFHDCNPRRGKNFKLKFVDDTTIIGRITNNKENSYREEINNLTEWCTENNLLRNINKTKELINDFRKKETKTLILSTSVSGAAGEQFQVPGNQHHRKQRTCHGRCTAQDRRALQGVIKSAQNITDTYLLDNSDISEMRCLRKAKRIVKDNTHPSNSLLSGCRLAGEIEESAVIAPVPEQLLSFPLFCFFFVFRKTGDPDKHILSNWQSGRLTTWISHLFKGLLFALAELLIFKFPLTEFSLQPLNALTQCKLVSGEDTKTQQTLVIFNTQSYCSSAWVGYRLSHQMSSEWTFHILYFHIRNPCAVHNKNGPSQKNH